LQFHSITFNNFKVYLGEHTIECPIVNKNQPIILIGGETGAGKTSILEGIKLCLYGRNNPLMLKGFYYNQFLADVHNKVAKKEGHGFSISVEYKTNKLRDIDIYKIERSWTLKNDKYEENLLLSINGDIVESISQSDYQEEINETFPAGVGDLLFFDSENFNKIPDFLENGFFDSLNKFLGIDLYRQLSDDLTTVKRHHINLLDESKSEQMQILFTTNTDVKNELTLAVNKIEAVKKEIDEHSIIIKDLTKILQKISGDLAFQQDEILKRKTEVSEVTTKYNNLKRQLYSTDMPFLYVKDLFKKLIDTLDYEKETKNSKRLNEKIKIFKSELFKELKQEFRPDAIKKINQHWNSVNKSYKKISKKIIHDISDSDFDNIKNIYAQVSKNSGNELDAINTKLKNISSEMGNITVLEKSVDSKGVGGNIYYEIKEHERQIDKKKLELEENIANKAIQANKLEKIEIEHQILDKKIKLDGVEKKKSQMVDNAKNLLLDFSTFLSENRFKSFKEHFLDTIKSIATKEELVSNIKIDQKSRVIKFLDKNDQPLSTKDFSAGESQIVAFALMWAVNVSTKKYFPIVTDSPFNRLDKDHRKNFVENILKQSNHQFIFLSTNEEIGNTQTLGIDKFISNTYLIEYDKKTKSSKISNKYFTE